MKLPAQMLEFVDARNGQSITTLDELTDAWLSANEAQSSSKDLHPAVEIVMELSSSPTYHDVLWLFIQQSTQRATTKFQLAMIAAGPLEDLIAVARPYFIDRIEDLARTSKRFRYVLTGVWPQGNRETIEWQRIEKARAAMIPHGIDSDENIPPADLPI